tara:strand:+ start:382 stop:567 length:186 start_codon:yes stop_codon:yes gene_type:complete
MTESTPRTRLKMVSVHQKHPFAKVAFSIILFNNIVTNLNKKVDFSNERKQYQNKFVILNDD